jgi:hypothetical protein
MAQTLGDETIDWDHIAATVAANPELKHLEDMRQELVTVTGETKAASVKQSTLRAQLQQTTRDLEKLRTRGTDLATRLRNGIRAQYGLRGEKLTEFGLQPRRKRTPKTKTPVKAPPSPAPEASTRSGQPTRG